MTLDLPRVLCGMIWKLHTFALRTDFQLGFKDIEGYLSNDPHKKESGNANARWSVNFFSLLQLVISLA